jgi:hypothetical protein
MASGRFLSVSIAEDDRLSRLSLEAEYVYLKTIPHLDRDGMISGKPGLLYSKVCPLREELFGKTADLIDEWVEVGLAKRFETSEGPVLFFRGFSKNNRLPHYDRERPSRFPPPPGYVRTEKGLKLQLQDSIQDEVQELVKDEVQELVPVFGTEEQEQEEDQDQGKGREAQSNNTPPLPPSLLIFREFCTKPTNATQTDAITSAITDLGLWRQVLTEWSLRGYNMGNVTGLLDWYRDGIPPSGKNGANHGIRTKGSQPNGRDDTPELDPELQRKYAERAERKRTQTA